MIDTTEKYDYCLQIILKNAKIRKLDSISGAFYIALEASFIHSINFTSFYPLIEAGVYK